MKRIYLCGPITAMENGNFEAFDAAERVLREAGYDVFNPHDLKLPLETPWEVCMRQCVGEMVKCDGLAVLEFADRSEGAMLEQWLAARLMIPALGVSGWLGYDEEARR